MYHLFAGHNYYPESGLGDYLCGYDTLEEAVADGNRHVNAEDYGPDWWVVITEERGRLVESARGRRG